MKRHCDIVRGSPLGLLRISFDSDSGLKDSFDVLETLEGITYIEIDIVSPNSIYTPSHG